MSPLSKRRAALFILFLVFAVLLSLYINNKSIDNVHVYQNNQIRSKSSTQLSSISSATLSPITLSTTRSPLVSLYDEYISKVNEYIKYEHITINTPQSNEYISYQELLQHENITYLIVSCKRFSVLSKSIESFEKYNTYPHISEKIVLDDCSTNDEILPMVDKYGMSSKYKYKFITNKIAKIESLSGTSTRSTLNQEYLIHHYALNKTKYYFKSEDDWIFFKHGFIEDSFAVKYGAQYWYNKSLVDEHIIHPRKILSLSLQNLQYPKLHKSTNDGHATCGGINAKSDRIFPQFFTSPILGYDNKPVSYGIIKYWQDCWGSYRNGPTLQHIDDYLLVINKYGNYSNLGKAFWGTAHNKNKWKIGNERLLACAYKDENYALATTIYNGYCAHGCSSCHVDLSHNEFDINYSQMNETFILDFDIFQENCLPKAYYNFTKN